MGQKLNHGSLYRQSKTMTKIRILVVDDHAIVRDGIVSMLQHQEGFEIVGEAESGEKALEMIQSICLDVVLMDIMMTGISGIEATSKIKEVKPELAIIILSMEVTDVLISEAIRVGALGYVPKDSKKVELIEAIRKVHKGEKYFSPKISEVVFRGFYDQTANGRPGAYGPTKITKREIEVLKLIASGLSNRVIADNLFISIRTVDAHRNHIMQKLELKTTAELVKYAIRHKIVELD